MELTFSDDYPLDLIETFETLKRIHKDVYNSIIGHLTCAGGECPSYDSTPAGEGYPYDYLLYAKDSIDPTIQILYKLYENIEGAFLEIKELK